GGPLQQPAVRLAHQGGGLLVAHVDRADAFLDAAGLGQQHRPTHDEEQVLCAFLLERLGQDFRAGQLCHVRLLAIWEIWGQTPYALCTKHKSLAMGSDPIYRRVMILSAARPSISRAPS